MVAERKVKVTYIERPTEEELEMIFKAGYRGPIPVDWLDESELHDPDTCSCEDCIAFRKRQAEDDLQALAEVTAWKGLIGRG